MLRSSGSLLLVRRIVVAVAVAVAGACATPTAVEGPPDLQGTVVGVSAESPVRSVVVERSAPPGAGSTRISLFVVPPFGGPSAAVYIRRISGQLERATVADLREGVRVTAWVRPGERRTDPPQWDAVRVVIETPELR